MKYFVFNQASYWFLVPEIIFIFLIFFVFVLGLLNKSYKNDSSFLLLGVYVLVFVLISLFTQRHCFWMSFYFFNFKFVSNPVISFSKYFILLVGILFILIVYAKFKKESIPVFDFLFLFLFSIFSLYLLVEVNDLFYIYLIVELQSLCFYIIISLRRYSNLSIEAAVKYFIFNMVASVCFLFLLSLTYGYFGTLNLYELEHLVKGLGLINGHYLVSFFFVFIYIFFKLALVPFHFWIADVFQGSPSVVLMLFAIVPKTSFVVLLIKFYFLFLEQCPILNYIVFFLALFSIMISSFVLLYEFKIKRLLAYSSINSMSHIVLIICLGTVDGMVSGLFYLLVYLILALIFFSLIVYIEKRGKGNVFLTVPDFIWLNNMNLFLAALVVSIFFSMIGVPPFFGFFPKFFIFNVLMNEGYYYTTGIVLLLNVMNAVFYLRLIRFIEFNVYTNRFLNRKNNFTKIMIILFCIVFFGNFLMFLFFEPIFKFLEVLLLSSFKV